MMRPLPLAACLALVSALSVNALAQDATPAAAEATPTETAQAAAPEAAAPAPPAAAAVVGNADAGRQLVYTCQGCHGLTGYKNAYPSYRVPKLGGQSETYLNNALNEYRGGKRKHPTMQAQAESFSEQDIADIAAYLSSIK